MLQFHSSGIPLEIAAILLAAGAGSRFGGDKLLHPWHDGAPIGAHAARNLIAAGLDVIAVVKAGDMRLAEALAKEGCAVSLFADAALGMGASLAHGVAQRPAADGWIVALGDMPAIRSETIATIARELAAGAALVAPSYQGKRGHPVGIGRRFGTQLVALNGDAGARDIIAAHRGDMTLIECGDPGVLQDIDTREDAARGG